MDKGYSEELQLKETALMLPGRQRQLGPTAHPFHTAEPTQCQLTPAASVTTHQRQPEPVRPATALLANPVLAEDGHWLCGGAESSGEGSVSPHGAPGDPGVLQYSYWVNSLCL